jgi:hypothetical protein
MTHSAPERVAEVRHSLVQTLRTRSALILALEPVPARPGHGLLPVSDQMEIEPSALMIHPGL